MRLRRESGDFQIVFTEPGLLPIRKGLSPEDLIGQVVSVPVSDIPTLCVIAASFKQEDGTVVLKTAAGLSGSIIYDPETGILTYFTSGNDMPH